MRNSCLVLLLAASAAAQTTGQIEGVVYDPSGKAAPATAVRILETGTRAERHLATDERGWYVVPALAPGSYDIEASRPGFRTALRSGVELGAGRAVRIDFALAVGESRETVVVTGEAAPVNTAPGDWRGLIDEHKLEALPLNGRDLYDLAAQQPGATVATTASRGVDQGMGIWVTVNGARPTHNSFRMDGIYVQDGNFSAPTSAAGHTLGLESIQELQLISTPFDAELGRAAGAALVAVSKSGTNDWHGDVYEYLRNSALDAKNFFDAPDQPIPSLRKNQFGALASGPLVRNRTFFLANYEGIRLASGETLSVVTPTEAARRGILPGRTVAVSPVAVPYLKLYPLPNARDFGDGTGEFQSQGISTAREDYTTGKLDFVASDRLRFGARYTHDSGAATRPEPLQVFRFEDDSRYHFLNTETHWLASPATIHAWRAGFSRVRNAQDASQAPSVPASLSFIEGQPLGPIQVQAGLTNLGGVIGDSVQLMPRRYVNNDFQFSYSLTHIRGVHTLRAGGSAERVQFNERADRGARGRYSFGSLTDLLLAKAQSADLMLPGSDTVRGWRQSVFSGFLQDDLRINARLSATLGVRYEAYTTPSEVNGKVATLRDFATATAFTTGGPLYDNPSAKNFAPRLSVAFAPFGSAKTVIRAGAGLFFDLLGSRDLIVAGVRVPPYFNLVTVNKPAFPDLAAAIVQGSPSNSLDMLDYYLRQPYIAQYQILVQQELPASFVLQAGYAGSRGIHLAGQLAEANPVAPQVREDGSLYFPAKGKRINPAFGRTRTRRTEFDSAYHALQAGLERRWRSGFRLQAKYAWAKSLDNTSGASNKEYQNSDGVPTMFNYRLNRGRSDFDLAHTFGANFSWALPGPRAALPHTLFGAWELHGMVQLQTGPPFNPIIGFDRARLGGGGTSEPGERPEHIAAPGARVILGDPQRWFDSAAFGLPEVGTYGNLGRNTLQGPGLASADLALHKVVWRTERQSLRLRVETFNVLNHPSFQIPSNLAMFSASLDRVGAAGRITETTTTARQIQLALKWAF